MIKAYGQILERELKEAKPIVTKAVQKINEQINYVSALIASLLDTSKIGSGKLILEPEVFELCSLVKEQVESFSVTQSSHQIKIAHEADCIVFADKVRTASVITNLLSNAVKYSPGANEVIVSIANEEPHAVKVSIQDFGLGIPVQDRTKYFSGLVAPNQSKSRRSRVQGLDCICQPKSSSWRAGRLVTSVRKAKDQLFISPSHYISF